MTIKKIQGLLKLSPTLICEDCKDDELTILESLAKSFNENVPLYGPPPAPYLHWTWLESRYHAVSLILGTMTCILQFREMMSSIFQMSNRDEWISNLDEAEKYYGWGCIGLSLDELKSALSEHGIHSANKYFSLDFHQKQASINAITIGDCMGAGCVILLASLPHFKEDLQRAESSDLKKFLSGVSKTSSHVSTPFDTAYFHYLGGFMETRNSGFPDPWPRHLVALCPDPEKLLGVPVQDIPIATWALKYEPTTGVLGLGMDLLDIGPIGFAVVEQLQQQIDCNFHAVKLLSTLRAQNSKLIFWCRLSGALWFISIILFGVSLLV